MRPQRFRPSNRHQSFVRLIAMFFNLNAKTRAPANAVLDRQLGQELMHVFYRQAHANAYVGILCTLAFTLVAYPGKSTPTLLVWFALMLCGYIARLWGIDRIFRIGRSKSASVQNNYLVFLGIMVFGSGWGYAAWAFIAPGHSSSHLPLLFLLSGMTVFFPAMLSAKPWVGIAMVIPMICGLALRLHEEAYDVFPHAVLIASMLSLSGIGLAAQHYKDLKKNIALGLEKESLFNRLLEAKERAEEIAYSKSAFLATMSHEIRTPINGLMGMLEILRDTDLNSAQTNYLNAASRSAESLLQLLNDILDYSKIEVGRLELEKLPFDWIAMTGEIALMNRVLAADKGIAFHLDIPAEGTSIVLGDPTRLRQIMNNLLSNALKFTSEGSITLKAVVENESDDKVMLSISVKDTGIGIEADTQAKLFQHYQQASAATNRKYGGTGLGLAISQQLAHLMGGNIRLISEPGKGSEFILTLPFYKSSPDALRTLASNCGQAPERFRAKVLVVEDDPVSQRVAVLMLKSFGITPTVVNTGGASLEAEAREHFDIVFMDSRLPDISGFQAARTIITRQPGEDEDPEKLKRPVIVAMTGADNPEDRKMAQESGIAAFMTKPVRKRDMRLCLERWAGRPQPPKQQNT